MARPGSHTDAIGGNWAAKQTETSRTETNSIILCDQYSDNTGNQTLIKKTVRDVTRRETGDVGSHEFDGTANLTLEKGTILIPAPTPDPRDPLNRTTLQKYIILGILTLYAVSGLCLVTALGALIVYFIPEYKKAGITDAQISGLQTYPSLFLGVGNVVSMPLAIAIGRRPVLLLSLLLLFISGVLCATNRNFEWHLAARSVAAFSAAQCQALVLLIIQDVFFLHQRGTTFQLFSSLEVLLNSSLTIASSYMAEAAGWRSWYWLFAGLSGFCFILAFLFVPETCYTRSLEAYMGTTPADYEALEPNGGPEDAQEEVHEPLTTLSERKLDHENYKPPSLVSDMRIFVVKPNWTKAVATWKHMCQVFFFPHVLWVSLMNGLFQGVDVSIQITYGRTLTSPPYNWADTSVSLIQLGQIIISLLSIPLIGWYSDHIIQAKARKNHGIHEPEHRLPPLIFPLLLCLMMTVIYGFAIQNQSSYHWFAIAFTVNVWLFLLLGASTVGTTYLLDAHPARAGSILVVIPVTRGLVSFGLSYHTTDYIDAIGGANTFGVYAGLMGFFGLLGILVYYKGKVARHYFSRWAV
ncbi:MFS general substrate transporter [Zopfia rhizophila CBS 207.26]|uniref:MFS general substrate transporter n=1 Tax=Zopfia rhizophila CBS 207.26 TaxID=1314779 RepID=A0A6A6ECU4_9PEZI|nr:MFS general substrate transporter [Zopfia rhizophila CBS 207.26]